MSSMAGASRRLANSAGKAKAHLRRRQPASRVADLSPEPRGRRRRRERYDSPPDLSGSNDELPDRLQKKVRQSRAARASCAMAEHPAPQPLPVMPPPLAVSDPSDDSSDDDNEEPMLNHLVDPVPIAGLAIGKDAHTAQPEPVPGPVAAPEPIPGPSNNHLYQRNAPEKIAAGPSSSGASSVKVEAPARHIVQTRILQPTNSDDKRPAQERVFVVDAKIDVPLGNPIVSALTNPVPTKSAHFHRMRAQIIGCRNISKDPSLTARGVNRDIFVSFALDPRNLNGGQSCLLVRFCSVPSEKLAADHHPPNLVITVNGVEIMKPKNVNYGTIKHKQWYPPVEIEAAALRAGPNQLSISWTLEGNSKSIAAPVENEYFLFVEVADRKTLDIVVQRILSRMATPDAGVAKVYKQMADGDTAGHYRTISLICDVDDLDERLMGKKAHDTLTCTDTVLRKIVNGNDVQAEIGEKMEDLEYSDNGPRLITNRGCEVLKKNSTGEEKVSGYGGDFNDMDGFSHAAVYEASDVYKDEVAVQTPNVFDEFIQSPKPETRKNLRCGRKTDLTFALCNMQGWRKNMEDFSTAVTQMSQPFEAYSFFGVFDGHKGSGASSYCSEHMAGVLTATEEFGLLMNSSAPMDNQEDLIVRGLVRGFLQMDDRIRLIPEVLSGHDQSGSTAICALFTPSMIFLANCGDSGAIIVSKGGVEVETRKHKPTVRTEKDRIRRAGGKVSNRRVGTLAVSRALGDFQYKSLPSLGPMEQLVSPEPEIYPLIRSAHDEFIVLASDGVWDVMSSEDVHQFVRSYLLITDDLELICGELAECCLEKRSRDNISVTIILLVGATSICEVARVQQQAMNQWAEIAVRDLIPIIGDSPIDPVTLSFMVSRVCTRKGQDFFPESTIRARQIIAERAWKTWNPCKPLMQGPANRLQELDMAIVEQYLCVQPQTAIRIRGERCGEVCNRNCAPSASGFTVYNLELDCQTIEASCIDDNKILTALREIPAQVDDNMILTALPEIAVYRLLYFQNAGESKIFPAIAYFFLPVDNGTLRIVRVHSYWLTTLSETLVRMAACDVFEYNRNIYLKHQNIVVPLDTTFEALRNHDRISKQCIFIFSLEE